MAPNTMLKSVLQQIPASLVMIMLAGSMLSGCETAQTRPDNSTDYLASVTPEHRRIIAKKQIAAGFTNLEVELAWGLPAYRRVSDDALQQIWYYTTIIQVNHYVTVKKKNPATGLDDYVEEPYPVQREVITRSVYFEEGVVTRWKIYPVSNDLIMKDESGNTPRE
jgi:hypothetical protein